MTVRDVLVQGLAFVVVACAPPGDEFPADAGPAAGEPDAGETRVDRRVFGPFFPASARALPAEQPWRSADEAIDPNGTAASADVDAEGSQLLVFGGFGFAIPEDADVVAVKVELRARLPRAAAPGVVNVLSVVGDDSTMSDGEVAQVTLGDEWATASFSFAAGFGSNNWLWPSTANDPTFKYALRFVDGVGPVEVDSVALKITWALDDGTLVEGPLRPAGLVSATPFARMWEDPGGALQSDGAGADVPYMLGGEETAVLSWSDFGIELPAEAEVEGITITIWRSEVDGHGDIHDRSLRLAENGQAVGRDRAEPGRGWTSATTAVSYGGPFDRWGEAWTPERLGSKTFGVKFRAARGGVAFSHADVDAVQVEVHVIVP